MQGEGNLENILCVAPERGDSKGEVNMKNLSTGKMARMAVLAAILIIMGFTPLGYLRVGVMMITFNMIPVVIGAVTIGPMGGAILGAVFGLTSFSQALTGADALGTALLGHSLLSAILLFIMCFVPRVLAGWLPGLFFRALGKNASTRKRVVMFALSSLVGSVANTVFFVSAFVGFFATNDIVTGAFGTTSVWAMVTILITANAVVEAIVCTIVGTGIGQAMVHFLPEKNEA